MFVGLGEAVERVLLACWEIVRKHYSLLLVNGA